jgi:hypothetical protein
VVVGVGEVGQVVVAHRQARDVELLERRRLVVAVAHPEASPCRSPLHSKYVRGCAFFAEPVRACELHVDEAEGDLHPGGERLPVLRAPHRELRDG